MLERKETWHIVVEGKVQGVGYRAFVQLISKRLGVFGFVRNLMDGRVEILVQAEPSKIEELVQHCNKGPYFSEVENLTKKQIETTQILDSFQIL